MTSNLTNSEEYSVCPGERISPSDLVLNELKLTGSDTVPETLANMDEYKDCFKINVAVPGVQQEDIFIHVQDNILSIAVLNRHCENFKKEKLQVIGFDTKCMGRHIHLPVNAAAELVSSAYKKGILSISIPKTREFLKTSPEQILVY